MTLNDYTITMSMNGQEFGPVVKTDSIILDPIYTTPVGRRLIGLNEARNHGYPHKSKKYRIIRKWCKAKGYTYRKYNGGTIKMKLNHKQANEFWKFLRNDWMTKNN